MSESELVRIGERVVSCTACARLVTYREEVARVKRRAYREEEYWGKPVPGFGDPKARLLVVGLAPGAHGANRTGRMFTGDRSGDFLFEAMYETGFASQPQGRRAGDGLRLIDAYMTGAGRCAPPDNKPLPDELDRCRHFMIEELAALPNIKVILCLGRIALEAYLKARGLGPIRAFPFAHGAVLPAPTPIVCSYHPSQQNTQTGRLTMPMLQAVFVKARECFGSPTKR